METCGKCWQVYRLYNNKIVVAVSLISGDGNLLPLCIKINARLTPNEWLQKRIVRSACYSMYCFFELIPMLGGRKSLCPHLYPLTYTSKHRSRAVMIWVTKSAIAQVWGKVQ